MRARRPSRSRKVYAKSNRSSETAVGTEDSPTPHESSSEEENPRARKGPAVAEKTRSNSTEVNAVSRLAARIAAAQVAGSAGGKVPLTGSHSKAIPAHSSRSNEGRARRNPLRSNQARPGSAPSYGRTTISQKNQPRHSSKVWQAAAVAAAQQQRSSPQQRSPSQRNPHQRPLSAGAR